MMPDGSNRRYLGSNGDLRTEYDDLREAEGFSPDGRYRAYATSDQSVSVQIWIQGRDQSNVLSTWQVSNLTKMSYDPVWSPDGSLIAFVSTELDQRRHLDGPAGRQRPLEPHPQQMGVGQAPILVARQPADRVLDQPRGHQAALRHGPRRQEPAQHQQGGVGRVRSNLG